MRYILISIYKKLYKSLYGTNISPTYLEIYTNKELLDGIIYYTKQLLKG